MIPNLLFHLSRLQNDYHRSRVSISFCFYYFSFSDFECIWTIWIGLDWICFQSEKNFMDSGSGLFAYATVVLGALPDFAYSFLTVIVYIPDHILDRFVDEWVQSFFINHKGRMWWGKLTKLNFQFQDSLKLCHRLMWMHISRDWIQNLPTAFAIHWQTQAPQIETPTQNIDPIHKTRLVFSIENKRLNKVKDLMNWNWKMCFV